MFHDPTAGTPGAQPVPDPPQDPPDWPTPDPADAGAWHAQAGDLARWAADRLVNRTDRCGRYYVRDGAVRPCADPPDPDDARDGLLDPDRLERHFRAAGPDDVVGVYAYGKEKEGKWVAVDIDAHDDRADPEANQRLALAAHGRLVGLGFRPLLLDSNGRGGFHLWTLLDRPVPAAVLHRFGLWLVRDHADHGLPKPPEVFPKNDGGTPWGHWLRLPGRHPKRGCWSKVWTGAAWVTGAAAADHLLSLTGDDPGLMPPEAAFLGVEPDSGADGPAGGGGGRLAPWEEYNRRTSAGDVAALLERHGWARGRARADGAVGFARPGKDPKGGESANLLAVDGTPIFYCFTDAAPPLKPGPYAPAALVAHLEHGGDFAASNRALAAAGYGAAGAGRAVAGGLVLAVTPAGRPGRHLAVAARPGGPDLHRDTLDLDSATARARFVAGVLRAAHPGVAPGDWPADVRADLDRLLLEAAADPPAPPAASVPDPRGGEDPRAAPLAATPADVRAAAEELLDAPDLLRRVAADLAAAGVVGEKRLALTLYLVGTSARLPRPLAAIVNGPSSSGKSYLVGAVAGLFPPEVVLHATSLTANALFYFEPGTLRHRWVVAGERSRAQDDDTAEATRALREMIEAGRLSKAVPLKEGDRIVTRLVEQDGPIAYAETTTLGRVFEEDANRCLILSTDERAEQTRRILAATASRAAGAGGGGPDRVRAVHHAVQRLLPRCDVAVPFAPAVAALFPADRVEARRNYRHLLQVVRAVALLHHRRRGRDAAGRVVADLADYEAAVALAARPLAVARGGPTDPARRFLDKIRPVLKDGPFDARQAQGVAGVSRSAAAQHLRELSDAGLVEQVEASRGNAPARWRLPDAEPPADTGGLPTRAEVAARPVGEGSGGGERPRLRERPEPGVDAASAGPAPGCGERPRVHPGDGGDTPLDLSFLDDPAA